MKTLTRESASAMLRPIVTHSDARSDREPNALLTPGEMGGIQALTWLTVGLGVLVTGLAVALIALAVIQ